MKKYFILFFLFVSQTVFAIDPQLNMMRDPCNYARPYQASTQYGGELRIYFPFDNSSRNMTFMFAGETITLDLSVGTEGWVERLEDSNRAGHTVSFRCEFE